MTGKHLSFVVDMDFSAGFSVLGRGDVFRLQKKLHEVFFVGKPHMIGDLGNIEIAVQQKIFRHFQTHGIDVCA